MEVFQMDNIQSYTTLTGLTLAQVAERLDAELPKDAYTAVPGGAGLTDIDPGYMRKVLTEGFGMCGIGWGHSFEPNEPVGIVGGSTHQGNKERPGQLTSPQQP